jgi:hypothetical protein
MVTDVIMSADNDSKESKTRGIRPIRAIYVQDDRACEQAMPTKAGQSKAAIMATIFR